MPLTTERLDALLAVEQAAYSHPWTRGNFIDALAAGYQGAAAGGGRADPGLLRCHARGAGGPFAQHHRGPGRSSARAGRMLMLDALALWARGQGAQWLWLEVRASNTRARQVYEAHGYQQVGLRKRYYPSSDGEREDAVVMSLRCYEPGTGRAPTRHAAGDRCHRLGPGPDTRGSISQRGHARRAGRTCCTHCHTDTACGAGDRGHAPRSTPPRTHTTHHASTGCGHGPCRWAAAAPAHGPVPAGRPDGHAAELVFGWLVLLESPTPAEPLAVRQRPAAGQHVARHAPAPAPALLRRHPVTAPAGRAGRGRTAGRRPGSRP